MNGNSVAAQEALKRAVSSDSISNYPAIYSGFLEKGIPESELERITWRNAAELFRLDVPESVIADPNAPWPSET